MTVSSTQSRKTFAGNGVTTSFATSPVVFFDDADLDVFVVTDSTGASETLVLDTDYTVTGGDGSTGTVNLAGGSSPYGAPAVGTTLVIDRQVDATQDVDLVNNDGSDAEVIEQALDRLTMLVQQHTNVADRVLRQPTTDPDAVGELPNVVDRASSFLYFDADGEPTAAASVTETAVSTFMETVLDDTTAAAARTTLDAQQDVFTTRGDLVRAGASGVAERVALGTAGFTLQSDGTDAVWGYAPVGINQGRLTLATATPVTTSDQTAKTTVYWAPYVGKGISLYSGTRWITFNQAELSVAVPSNTVTPFDVFMDYNSGTPQLVATAWTNDTTRATGLTTQDGILVKSGSTGQRYLGTGRTTGSSGQTEDSVAKRFLWNYYHRIDKNIKAALTADRTTTSATYVEINSEIRNEWVIGVAEDSMSHSFTGVADAGGASSAWGFSVGIGGTTAEDVINGGGFTGTMWPAGSLHKYPPAAGYNYATLLAKIAGGSTLSVKGSGTPGSVRTTLHTMLRG